MGKVLVPEGPAHFSHLGHPKEEEELNSLVNRLLPREAGKNDQNDLRTGTRAEFRPFVEALFISKTLLVKLNRK